MTWGEILKIGLAVFGVCAFVGFMLWKFIDRLTDGYEIHTTFKQQNDEINAQVEENETPSMQYFHSFSVGVEIDDPEATIEVEVDESEMPGGDVTDGKPHPDYGVPYKCEPESPEQFRSKGNSFEPLLVWGIGEK